MAIEVRIPKEIKEYKEKVIFGMSIRQLVCFSSAVVLSIGAYLLCTKVFNLTMDEASYAIILISIPIMALGFIKINGFTFEKFAALYIRHITGQQIRKYQTELLTDQIITADGMEKKGGNYAWIFDKEKTGKGKSIIDRKTKIEDRTLREYEVSKSTKESRKRKRKTALRKIKAARKEYRSLKRRAQKNAKAASRTQDVTADTSL